MHDTFSRRSFLKAGALTAAGLWAAPQLPAQAAAWALDLLLQHAAAALLTDV